MTCARGVLTQRETDVAQCAQRLHLRTAVLERFGHAERHLVPGARLGVPAHILLEAAGAQQRRDHAGRVAALLAFERLDVRLEEHLRSEEHTSELQSLAYLVCRLLLEKKKKTKP